MTEAELRQELETRERQMQSFQGQEGVMTDQWRVYKEARECIEAGSAPLRLCLQASAGTGKSFLLETLFLWAILNGHNVKAAAPTGIAAARLRMPRTPLSATTVRYLFGLSIDGESKIDTTSPADDNVQRIAAMTILIIDEASMIDDETWLWLRDQLSSVGAAASRIITGKTPARRLLWPTAYYCGHGHETTAPGHVEATFHSWRSRVSEDFPVPSIASESKTNRGAERRRTTRVGYLPWCVGRCCIWERHATSPSSARGCLC